MAYLFAAAARLGGATRPRGSGTSRAASAQPAPVRAGRAPRHLAWGTHVVFAGALAVLCALQVLALWRAPAAWYPAAIRLSLPAGASVVLGRDQLAAPRAAPSHVRIEHAASGEWLAAAVSQAAPIAIQRGDEVQRSGTVPITESMRFALGAARFHVTALDSGSVTMTDGQSQWRFDGGTVYRDGHAQVACPDAHVGARIATIWNRFTPRLINLRKPLAFGGNLHCATRIGIPNVDAAAATLIRTSEAFILTATPGAASPLVVNQSPAHSSADRQPSPVSSNAAFPARAALPLAAADALIVGQTRFAIRTVGDVLTLTPSRHVTLYTSDRADLPSNVSWDWRQRQHWTIPSGPAWRIAAVLIAVLLLATAIAAQRGRWPFTRDATHAERIACLAGAALAIAGLTALLMQRAGTPLGAGISLLLNCAALWTALILFGRSSLAVSAAVILLATGLLAQLELGLGGADIAWLRHFQKTSALLALGIGTASFAVIRLNARPLRIPQLTLEWLLAALALLALAALAAQVLLGDETGVFDLQPVEFAKLALTALTAHCIAVGLGWQQQRNLPSKRTLRTDTLRWLRMSGPVFIFMALLGLALVQVDDYSPLILLTVWSTAILLTWSIATRRWLLAIPVLLAAAAGVAAIVMLREAGPQALAGMNFYGDRFQVWLDPATHPHTGEQMLLGARAIADGGWFGADNWFGLRTLGQSAGDTLRIPAVQDDFAPAFFLNRHGLAAALLLWTVQALFLAGLLQAAARAWKSSAGSRDFHGAWLGRFRCFALCGGAAFVLGHFLLSWGTNLAIFPVMGQPMSFLSAGGSHLLFFICPLLGLVGITTISAQNSEEVSSCRSMSNTRC
ncbi:FtsW/RodA/SpoVE family cell cycle protein [Massilia arenosa]|uniref:Probable peptidoglycan glycosyltransferase FtsW n=1 Tax=Zemynaea arenosa TaxID=2561931 RepID=A0A4Y9SFW7_9BURK|nr:FtsW/RodA/SpoVE family cell cycle protein [Massilia arenosa]